MFKRVLSFLIAAIMLLSPFCETFALDDFEESTGSNVTVADNNLITDIKYEDIEPENPEWVSSADNIYLSNDELTSVTKAVIDEPLHFAGENISDNPIVRSIKRTPTVRGSKIESIEQTPVKLDGKSIDKITVKWLSTSTNETEAAGFNRLEKILYNDTPFNIQFQLDFTVRSEDKHGAGTIEIVLPAYILEDRYGKEAGELTLGIPEAPESSGDFAWRREGNKIIITNTKDLAATSKGMILCTWRNIVPTSIVDIDTTDLTAAYPGITSALSATITLVTNNGATISMTSNEIDASIDTESHIINPDVTNLYSVIGEGQKKYLYFDTDIIGAGGTYKLPEELLPSQEDIDDYAYVGYYITNDVTGSQPYSLYYEMSNPSYNGVILGGIYRYEVLVNGKTNTKYASVSPEGNSISMPLIESSSNFDSTFYGMIWVAYPLSSFPDSDTLYTVSDTVNIVLVDVDDQVRQVETLTGDVSFYPPVYYHIEKTWDDNDDAAGNRPDTIPVRILYYKDGSYRLFKLVNVKESDGWTATFHDNGTHYNFYAYEGYYNYSNANLAEDLMVGNKKNVLGYRYNGYEYSSVSYYTLKEKTYDQNTRTWTFLNEYNESVGDATPYSTAFRKDTSSYYDYRDSSNWNNFLLNTLLNGKSADVVYSANAHKFVNGSSSNPVNVVFEDNVLKFDGAAFMPDEYDFSQAVIHFDSSSFVPSGTAGYYNIVKDEAQTPFQVYMLKDGEYILCAEISESGAVARNGASVSSESRTSVRVVFPKGTKGFKVVSSVSSECIYFYAAITVTVYPTERIKHIIESKIDGENSFNIPVNNTAFLKATTSGSTIFDLQDNCDAFLDYFHFSLRATLEKEFTYISNDVTNRYLNLSVKGTLKENLNSSAFEKIVKNNLAPFATAGTYYDLLPEGVIPDISTISLSGSDRLISAYTIQNYRGTGRTMLVINVELVPLSVTFYKQSNFGYEYGFEHWFTFNCFYDWVDAALYGLSPINYIVFEAADERLGNTSKYMGECDIPSGQNNKYSVSGAGAYASVLTDIDPEHNKPVFLYANDILDTDEIDIYALTSLAKHVSLDGYTPWDTGLYTPFYVYSNQPYTYRLKITSESDTQTKGIILLDKLESYVPDELDTNYGDKQWKGLFKGIDVNPLISAGVAPVVYYCTSDSFDIENLNTTDADGVVISALLNSSAWSTTPPSDLSTVTAIAIDCRYDADGNEFVLGDGETIYCRIHMIAPFIPQNSELWGADAEDPDQNAHAYNHAFVDIVQLDALNREHHKYLHCDYTKVGIKKYRLDVDLTFSDEDDRDGKRPSSVYAELLANGVPSGIYISLDESNSFSQVLYVDKFDSDGRMISYTVNNDIVDEYYTSSERVNDTVRLLSEYIPERVSLSFKKEWVDNVDLNGNTVLPPKIVVRLYQDGEFSGTSLNIDTQSAPEITGTFDNLYRFHDGGIEYVYSIVEDDIESFIKSQRVDEDGTIILTNTYYPYGDLKISKEVINGTTAANQVYFDFRLTLKDKDGNLVNDLYEYQMSDGSTGVIGNGYVFSLKADEWILIKDIYAGHQYSISEVVKPGFSNTKRVNTSGIIKSGTEIAAAFTNTYAASGNIKIQFEKILNGRSLASSQFRFELYDSENRLIGLASNTLSGYAAFSKINYTQEDDGKTFVYYVKETNRGISAYTYDASVYTITVTVADVGNGKLVINTTASKSGTPVTDIEFVNQYSASGDIALNAWKTIFGLNLTGGEFNFELLNSSGEVIGTAVNDADGLITFPSIYYTQADVRKTFYYVAREVAGTDPSINYSNAIFGYKVTVADNGDGTLHVSSSPVSVTNNGGTFEFSDDEGPAPIFNNTLKPGKLNVAKNIIADNQGRIDNSSVFRFYLRLSGQDVNNLLIGTDPVSGNPIYVMNGQASFSLMGGQSVLLENIPAGLNYRVYEDSLEKWTQYSQTNTAGVVPSLSTTNVSITNQYSPASVSVSFVGYKTLDNRPAANSLFTFQLLSGNTVIETVTNLDGGFIQFSPISYTETGTYTYTIKEVVGSNPDILYDLHEETVTVTVSEVSSGLSLNAVYDTDGIVFSNITKPGSLTITKNITGYTTASQNTEFVIKITFFNENGTPLSGDNVYYYLLDSNGERIENPDIEVTKNASLKPSTVTDKSLDTNTVRQAVKTSPKILVKAAPNLRSTGFDASAYDPSRAAGYDENGIFHATDDMLLGTAYAVWNPTTGEMVFVRSYETYVTDSTAEKDNGSISCNSKPNDIEDIQTVTDIYGNVYTGRVFQYLENSTTNNYNVQPGDNALTYPDSGPITKDGTMVHFATSYYSSSKRNDVSAMANCRITSVRCADGIAIKMPANCYAYFYGNESLASIDTRGLDFTNTQIMDEFVAGCTSLTSLDLTHADFSNLTDIDRLFNGCSSLTSIDLSDRDLSTATSAVDTFTGLTSLVSFDISGMNLSGITDNASKTSFSSLFKDNSNLRVADMSGVNISAFTSLASMFENCPSLEYVDLSNMNISAVTTVEKMFYGDSSLTSVDASGITAGAISNYTNAFSGLTSIESLNLNDMRPSSTASVLLTSAFEGDTALTQLNINEWNCTVTNAASAFKNLSSLQTLDLSGLKSSSTTASYFADMFAGANIHTLTLGSGLVNMTTNVATSANLITPSGNMYTGKWVSADGAYGPFTSEELLRKFSSSSSATQYAGTYIWEVKETFSMVTLNGNGGYLANTEYAFEVPFSITLPTESEITNPGKLLSGWNTEPDGSGTSYAAGSSFSVTEPKQHITLYAIWIVPANIRIEHYKQNATLDGYTLVDTSTSVMGVGTTHTLYANSYDDFVTPPNQTVTIVGDETFSFYYDRAKYTVHYDGNGADGGNPVPDSEFISGITGTLRANTFTRSGAMFMGWSDTADDSGNIYTDVIRFSKENGSTMTLYARWFVSDASVSSSMGEVYLKIKGGEQIVFPQLPYGTTYIVEEIDIPSGWTQKSSSGVSGTVTANSVNEASFLNEYATSGIAPVIAHIGLDGREVKTGEFRASLYPALSDGTVNGDVIGSFVNGEIDLSEYIQIDDESVENPYYLTGPVSFDNIVLNSEGTYYYIIKQDNLGDPEIFYDEHDELVVVNAVDNGDGTLNITVTYDSSGPLYINKLNDAILHIIRQNVLDQDRGIRTFVYSLISKTTGEVINVTLYGNNDDTLYHIKPDVYTVVQDNYWSWRYTDGPQEITLLPGDEKTVIFDIYVSKEYWLAGDSRKHTSKSD